MPELPITAKNTENDEIDGNDILDKNVAIALENYSCYWDYSENITISKDDISQGERESKMGILALEKINVKLKMNELTCVIGSVGSGKSGKSY